MPVAIELNERPEDLYEAEGPIREYGVDVPPWIDQEIDGATVAAIAEGGCASGAYMPAVRYHDAFNTMGEHGNAVTDFLGEWHDSVEYDPRWAQLCVRVLSRAVEAWASSVVTEWRHA